MRRKNVMKILWILIFIGISINCSNKTRTDENKVYTLYRNSVTDGNLRIHVATFDALEAEGYNCDNCQTAQQLFQNQDGVIVRFWCEKGYFKK